MDLTQMTLQCENAGEIRKQCSCHLCIIEALDLMNQIGVIGENEFMHLLDEVNEMHETLVEDADCAHAEKMSEGR